MGWISWLCPGMNLKRWLLLFTVGVLCCALGLALFFNYQFMGYVEELMFRMTYLTTGKYSNTVSMLGGFLFLCIGGFVMIYATRRVIRSVVEAVLPDNNSSLMEKIFTQRKLGRGPAITVIGGGTGLSTLLRGMKYITSNCNAVVTVADDGGSSGRLRKEMGIIPPGDLRNCLVALADREPLMERIMQFRFNDGSPLAGHNFGNLFIAAMAEAEGSMEAGLAATSQILNVRGKVIPSTLSDIRLKAEMTDGTLIEGESEIPKAHKRIRRVGIEPSNVQATSSAVDAIMKADVLILGPGSLYTSVIPNLMVEGIREAVLQSDAVKIFAKDKVIAGLPPKMAVIEKYMEKFGKMAYVGNARQCGMLAGIELMRDKENKVPFDPALLIAGGICQNARKYGLIVRNIGDVIIFMPPLASTAEQIEEMLGMLEKSMAEVFEKIADGSKVDFSDPCAF
jgi:uncharacterized cofD-like protein